MFAHWFTSIPVLFSMMHLWDEEWDAYLPFPLSKIGKYCYYFLFWIYRKNHTLTISQSSKFDLVDKLWFDSNNISIIEPLWEVQQYIWNIDNLIWSKKNEIIFIGRLMPIKRVEDAIRAFDIFAQTHSDYIFNIIWGMQDMVYVEKIKKLVSNSNHWDRMFLRGNVLESEKQNYLESAKLLLVTSKKEWFGLIVHEANHCAIPAIGYDVHGLRDSIKNDINGQLVTDHDIIAIANQMCIVDSEWYANICKSSVDYVQKLDTWEGKWLQLIWLLYKLEYVKK